MTEHKGHKEMKTRMILAVVAMVMLSGCLMFYTGSEEGPFGVVAGTGQLVRGLRS